MLVDQTDVGEPVLEEIRNQGISNVEGVKFAVQTKEELLSSLKIVMEQNRLAIPYHRQLFQQINDACMRTTRADTCSSAIHQTATTTCCGVLL